MSFYNILTTKPKNVNALWYSFFVFAHNNFTRSENMYKNKNIKCDVTKCRHNAEGSWCELQSIQVGCSEGCGEKCTCCESFDEI